MKILIVDDEPNILTSIGSALKRTGHDVLTARSFSEAEGLLHGGIDVALLDVWLGEKDGIQLLKLIKNGFPDIECVMISGHAEIETAVLAGCNTNGCVFSSACVGSNMGFDLIVPADATACFAPSLQAEAENWISRQWALVCTTEETIGLLHGKPLDQGDTSS